MTFFFCCYFAEIYGWKIIDGDVHDIRIIGSIALLVMIIVCAVGMEWETKAQNFLVAIIVAAIVNFIIGCLMGPRDPKQVAQGFIGFSSKLIDSASFHCISMNNPTITTKFIQNWTE